MKFKAQSRHEYLSLLTFPDPLITDLTELKQDLFVCICASWDNLWVYAYFQVSEKPIFFSINFPVISWERYWKDSVVHLDISSDEPQVMGPVQVM